MSFRLRFTDEASALLDDLAAKAQYAQKLEKVNKALGILETNPRHPGLHSHPYESITGPDGQTVWDSYVENKTPSAWRIWWCYGKDKGAIDVISIGPHPD